MQNYQRHPLIIVLLSLLLILPIFFSFSFAEDSKPVPVEIEKVNGITVDQRAEKLNDIEMKMAEINERKKSLQKQLKNSGLSDEEKTDLTQRLQTLSNQSKDFNALFEQTVLGGIDLTLFQEVATEEPAANLNYNWQQEVLQILQPFFAQMQRMTEKARTRDLLIEERKDLNKKIELANTGIATLKGIDQKQLNDQSIKLINKLDEEWLDKIKSLEHQKNIVDLKLQDLTDNRNFFVKFTDNLWSFIKNEGLAILIALVVSIGFYYIFSRFILVFVRYQQQEKSRVTNFKWRLLLLIFQSFNIIFSISIFLVILHTSGNIMLFGIVGLILLMLAISFRTKIPNYINKLRVFLNLGQAREGERILYNDIPWEITKINLNNVYLTNPLLDNGKLRVTLDLIDKLYSRETINDELWFPSRKGDILLLPDKRIVQVLRQTPESVYLDHDGSTIVMGTSEFYKLKFSNLSRGYSLTLNFTLEDTPEARLNFDDVKAKMQEGIYAEMKLVDEALPDMIKRLNFNIRQLISANSTSYQIVAEMNQHSAKHYLKAKGALNSAIIHTARDNGWSILLTENI